MSEVATTNNTGRHLNKHSAVTRQIEPLENLSAVKMKKAVRSLVVAVVFLAGCSSSSSTNTAVTGGTRSVPIVNGYKIEPFANLTGANLQQANLGSAELNQANLRGANLYRTDLSFANLAGADLTNANLAGADLDYADLTGANLTNANLTDAGLENAHLTEANLESANLLGANLTGADLFEAELAGADLRYANLTHANLTHANLTRANLTGADLTNAKLTGADRTGLIWERPPPPRPPNSSPDSSVIQRQPVTDYYEGDDPEPPSPGIGNDSENDYGFDDGPCYGDCNDMDNDGRTWDDYDADGDGRYETR